MIFSLISSADKTFSSKLVRSESKLANSSLFYGFLAFRSSSQASKSFCAAKVALHSTLEEKDLLLPNLAQNLRFASAPTVV